MFAISRPKDNKDMEKLVKLMKADRYSEALVEIQELQGKLPKDVLLGRLKVFFNLNGLTLDLLTDYTCVVRRESEDNQIDWDYDDGYDYKDDEE